MPVSSMATISCCHRLRPPSATTAKLGTGATTATAGHLPMLRRACLAAACAVAVGATGAVDGAAMATSWGTAGGAPHEAVEVARVQAASRWSDRRQCPPWRANSLENVVPENLPRPAPRRRFNGVAAADKAQAPTASPDAVAPFLALRSGSMGCFSL